MILILDYNLGNPGSIKNMLKKIGIEDVIISCEESLVSKAEKIILPGVGAFDHGMEQLMKTTSYETLNNRVLNDKVPVLGICLGAQMLTEKSEEGRLPGLGWIKGQTILFRKEKMNEDLKIPNMGWNQVRAKKKSKLLQGLDDEARFYFVHSYHIICAYPEDELLCAEYGYEYTAAVERGNILGVQFHPEKSHKYGMQLLKNFVTNY